MLFSSYRAVETEKLVYGYLSMFVKGIVKDKGNRMKWTKLLLLTTVLPLVVVGLLSWLLVLFPQFLLFMIIGLVFFVLMLGIVAFS
ncbi:hypothetical protein [Paenibacillus illinoisensis]|uniref:Uncharacterized protein n=1 Tax=Paenibacillus illinoisensis TaxID=59845 RepID=A0A2W0C8C6_9BACL|nr:hypothetical protein [Paenibacillus illinoisensis]PYY28297.1 hypothetical protein PIL02S_03448 [Paenibacillus illinoisensis]